MRSKSKKWTAAALAAAMALMAFTPALAASKDKIASVKITLEWDGEPKAGESVGSINAKVSDSAHYKVVDSYYENADDDDEWERGKTPIVRVELEIKDEYVDTHYFSKLSSSKISISGCHGTYKTSKTLDGGRGYQVDINLRKVSGDLEDVDDLYWDGRTAVWEEVEDADKYEVKLYRNGSSVTTVTTTNNRYGFSSYMTKAGDYSFKVRAVSNSDGEKSSWTDESEDYYVDSKSVSTGGSSNGSSNNSYSSNGWNQDAFGWVYRYSDGNIARNTWIFVDNNWFYMADNGYMMTGWIFVDNNWFYLNPVSNGTRGAMMTGWQAIDGAWYYLNPVSDGTRGARKTGYQIIDGAWYFLDPVSGARWANRMSPYGQWIDANGVVH